MIAKVILIGILTATSYRPVPGQTKPSCKDRFHCTTSIDDGITQYGIAVSQDLLKSGRVHYGDVLYVEGYGFRVVNDCMGLVKHENHKALPIRNSVDMLVFTRAEEKAVGERHLHVYKVESFQHLPGEE